MKSLSYHFFGFSSKLLISKLKIEGKKENGVNGVIGLRARKLVASEKRKEQDRVSPRGSVWDVQRLGKSARSSLSVVIIFSYLAF